VSITKRTRQILITWVLPVTVVGGSLFLLLASEDGVMGFAALSSLKEERGAAWARADRENARLIFRDRMREEDPINLERDLAERSYVAPPGATIYRFEPDG